MTARPPSAQDRAAEARALKKVQQRVAAIGFFAVAIHGVFGLIVFARVIDEQGRHGQAMILLFISAVVALLTYTVIRVILQRPLWSPVWLVLTFTPAVAAALWLA